MSTIHRQHENQREITCGLRAGVVKLPPSKSVAQRALLMSFARFGSSYREYVDLPYDEQLCQDISAMIDCVDALIASGWDARSALDVGMGSTADSVVGWSVSSAAGSPVEPPIVLDARESGAVARFMCCLALLNNIPVQVVGSSSLLRRTMNTLRTLEIIWGDCAHAKRGDELFTADIKHGILFDNRDVLSGNHPSESDRASNSAHQSDADRVSGGARQFFSSHDLVEVTVSARTSSQYVSGLLLASAFRAAPTIIAVTTEAVSASYIALTLQVMRDFGVTVIVDKDCRRFVVQPPRTREGVALTSATALMPIPVSQAPTAWCYYVARDMSAASFWRLAQFWGNNITIEGITEAEFVQGDAKAQYFLNLLREFDRDYQLKSITLQTLTIDLAHYPDLYPVLSLAAASLSSGLRVTFTHIAHLKNKESNRLDTVDDLLVSCGAVRAYRHDGCDSVTIEAVGSQMHPPKSVASHGDHRIAMAGAMLALMPSQNFSTATAVQSMDHGSAVNPTTSLATSSSISSVPQTVTIMDASCVTKSYPQFFDELAACATTTCGESL